MLALARRALYTVALMKTGELAERLGIHPNTIRVWCKSYAAYLSRGAAGRASGVNRDLSERDCLVLATVADMRADGLPHEAIVASLENGNLVTALPDIPAPEETAARERVELIPVAELKRALDQIRTLENERDRVIAERDAAMLDAKEAGRRIVELEREIGRLQGRFEEVRRGDWWLKYIAIAVLILAAVLLAALAFGYAMPGG